MKSGDKIKSKGTGKVWDGNRFGDNPWEEGQIKIIKRIDFVKGVLQIEGDYYNWFSIKDWEEHKEEDKKVKCIYCKKPIHINKFAGVNKEGMFCNGVTCLIELSKKLNKKEDGADNWNLANESIMVCYYPQAKGLTIMYNPSDEMIQKYKDKRMFTEDDIKTFIQKVKEGFRKQQSPDGMITLYNADNELDKIAGRL